MNPLMTGFSFHSEYLYSWQRDLCLESLCFQTEAGGHHEHEVSLGYRMRHYHKKLKDLKSMKRLVVEIQTISHLKGTSALLTCNIPSIYLVHSESYTNTAKNQSNMCNYPPLPSTYK